MSYEILFKTPKEGLKIEAHNYNKTKYISYWIGNYLIKIWVP